MSLIVNINSLSYLYDYLDLGVEHFIVGTTQFSCRQALTLDYKQIVEIKKKYPNIKLFVLVNALVEQKYLEDLKASGQLTLGETHDTAYYGDKGQTAYSHSITTGNPHNTTYEEVGADKSGAANVALTSSKDYTDEKISEVNTELDKRALTSELTIHTSDKVVHITVEERTSWNESYQNAVAYTDQKIAALINGAPETLDTLKEIADAMEQNESVVEALNNAIGTKANLAEFNSHESNTTVHITAAERKKWNAYTTQISNLQKSINTVNKTLASLGNSVTELQNKQGYPIAKEN